MTALTIESLQRTLSYRFRDRRLCELALTHRSWANHRGRVTDNERLEFLGDSILGLTVALWLYQQHPTWSEGELTKGKSQLVSQAGLVRVGERLQLRSLIRVGHSQGLDPIPESILAGATEALVGAILVDGGLQAADRAIRRLWRPFSQAVKQGRTTSDYKSQLQEWSVQHWRVLPQYHVVSERGPAHAREFEVVVKIKGRPYGRAKGHSKKTAEQQAAQAAWQRLRSERRKEGTHG